MRIPEVREEKVHATAAAWRRLTRLKVAAAVASTLGFSGFSAGIALGTASASAAPVAAAKKSATTAQAAPAPRHPVLRAQAQPRLPSPTTPPSPTASPTLPIVSAPS
jgi:hypothetical protein